MSEEQKPSWKVRRRIVHTTLLFCAGVVIYSLVMGPDTKAVEVAITMSYILAGSVIGSYVFGAVWDDKKK